MLENGAGTGAGGGGGTGGASTDDASLLRFQMELKGRIVAIIAIHVGCSCRCILLCYNTPSSYNLSMHPINTSY